jgi:predicted dinucleotide-binding enzyme
MSTGREPTRLGRSAAGDSELRFEVMLSSRLPGLKRVLFVAGDDRLAVAAVGGIIAELGLHPIVLGSLAAAGRRAGMVDVVG